MDLGVEHCGADAVVGEQVGVGVREAFDQAVEPQPGEVVAHLVGGVGPAEQFGHPGAQAPVGEPDGVQGGAQGAEQGHDPRVAEPQGWGPPAIRVHRWHRDPLKGWTRKDTTLPGAFSIE